MDNLLLSVLALLAATNMALAIVCEKDICNRVDCKEVTEENCAYTIVPNGGFCRCCDACVHMLKEGEECPTFHVMDGPPPTVRCGDGLICNSETSKCEAA